jgi:hypothetical protein
LTSGYLLLRHDRIFSTSRLRFRLLFFRLEEPDSSADVSPDLFVISVVVQIFTMVDTANRRRNSSGRIVGVFSVSLNGL